MDGLFRISPHGTVASYKTYGVAAPLRTHWRVGTCEEAECQAYEHGWLTRLDISTPLGKRQVEYISLQSGRRFVLSKNATIWEYRFYPGQQCFAQHHVPLERDPLLFIRDGDWRGNPTGRKQVLSNVDDWVGEFADHQDKLAERYNNG